MGYNCDYCGEARSMVYCRLDEAYLCLSCDRNIHSANALSKRHSRTLICDKCNSQPAYVRCVDEKLSLCQNCDWECHNGSNSSSHSKQTLNCYSGCPSADELSSIWSFMSESPAGNDSNCEQVMGLMSISENKNDQDLSVDDVTQQVNAKDSTTQKIVGTKGGDQFIDDRFDDDFTTDEVDLSIENYEVLFGEGHNDPKHLFAKDGIDSLFAAKDTFVAESVCHGAYAAKPSENDHRCGYFMWKSEFDDRLRVISSASTSQGDGSALTECSSCNAKDLRINMLKSQKQVLETRVRMLEARLEMATNPDDHDHACQSAAILCELLGDLDNLHM